MSVSDKNHDNPPWDPPWDQPVTRVYFPPGAFDARQPGYLVPATTDQTVPVPQAQNPAPSVAHVQQIGADRKNPRLEGAALVLNDARFPFRVCSPHHWQARLPEGLLDYWPSTGKWRWKGQSHNGNPQQLHAFLQDILNSV